MLKTLLNDLVVAMEEMTFTEVILVVTTSLLMLCSCLILITLRAIRRGMKKGWLLDDRHGRRKAV